MTNNKLSCYQETLDYIYSFVDFSRSHQVDLDLENFDLSRMKKVMEMLDSPQHQFRSMHVAGSKGKGSVSAFCAAILQQAGYKVGLYTSPHLRDFEERIQVNRVPISRKTLVDYVEEIKPTVAAVPGLTTFEIMTVLGFLFFARQDVDLAVIEVGLGGRLDATNVITPLVSVITSLYLDHTSILGDTLEEIAAEKGGIIKPGVPVVTAPQEQEALQVIQKIAYEKDAPLIEVDQEYAYQITEKTLKGQSFRLAKKGDGQNVEVEYFIPLLGTYQVTNAVTALVSLDVLRGEGFNLDEVAAKEGLAATEWPARFEVLRKEPPLIVDSAHNPAAMRKLIETLDTFFPDHSLILVFGISEDKQLEGMYREILPRTEILICTQADHPRAMHPEMLVASAVEYSCRVETIPVVRDALNRALQLADDKFIVLVTGSIFVAASARIAWFENGLSKKPNH
jgi:dihydrofolate synthase/folylpolyglutamate synthase